jgi:dihydrodipicolinate synthase/N-acetylneuraminate lyase
MRIDEIPADLRAGLRRGLVIPACPLALNAQRSWDPRRQRALARYYLDAGAGGLAVGVHSTQFEIREPTVALYEPVLKQVSQEIDAWSVRNKRGRSFLKIAGVCGRTPEAEREASLAGDLGYHACLLSLSALRDAGEPELIAHCRAVAARMPVFGFYLQPAAGGRRLSYEFWRAFAGIPNVVGIKMAPFNRYQTLDVIRGVCDAGREDEIVLYTGNDDQIVVDLLTPWEIETPRGMRKARMVGGLLGHWGFWTREAVRLLARIHEITEAHRPIPPELLTLNAQVTDANAAVFDAAHGFAGCLPGIHEMLRRVGLLEGRWCLNPKAELSPGQSGEIDRICRSYPWMSDADFVKEHLAEWLDG